MFYFKHKFADWAWSLTTVSIAAQIATFPISLHYFHQFPNYFLISNLIAIPAATGILSLGLLKLAVGWVPFLSYGITWILEKLIWITNESMLFIDHIPCSVTHGIIINPIQTLCIYATLVLLLLFINYKKLGYFKLMLAPLLIFISIHITNWYQNRSKKEMVVYDISGFTALGLREGHTLSFVYSGNLKQQKKKMKYSVQSHWEHDHIDAINYFSLDSDSSDLLAFHKYDNNHLITWNGQSVFIMNHALNPYIHNLPTFDLVILRDNVYLHDTFYEYAHFNQLIVDSSCKRWYINKHYDWLKAHSAHIVSEKGAFIWSGN